MSEKIKALKAEISSATAKTQEELEGYRLKFISRKSVLGDLFADIKNIAPEDRKAFGQEVNEVKQLAEEKFKELIAGLDSADTGSKSSAPVDLTLPPNINLGTVHPLTYIHNRIVEIFQKIGFNVADGPEIEDDFHNFTALNFPENHPAREMQDTFLLKAIRILP